MILHLRQGSWVVGAELDGNPLDHEMLSAKGWTESISIGGPPGDLWIRAWREPRNESRYLLQVFSRGSSSPDMLVDTFPELMDLLVRWAPLVQVAANCAVLDQLAKRDLDVTGMVERIGARLRFGSEQVYDDLDRVSLQEERARRRGSV